ncbi:hypothetical protein [Methylobacterium platani]|uniref:hypothetical protein n=1 Tax=Methylobacterium platani TaxID=427683 RepID=UPI000AEA8952|nr:hypothetical protein [Methylobacterium platani]
MSNKKLTGSSKSSLYALKISDADDMTDLLPADLDAETIKLISDMQMDGVLDESATRSMMIERLRRLEDFARANGSTRQIFQKISSARRLLGDKEDFGKILAPFVADR